MELSHFRFDYFDSYPWSLYPLAVATVIAAVALGTVAVMRWRSKDPARLAPLACGCLAGSGALTCLLANLGFWSAKYVGQNAVAHFNPPDAMVLLQAVEAEATAILQAGLLAGAIPLVAAVAIFARAVNRRRSAAVELAT